MMDLIPLQMILALFQLNSNYFLKQFSLHFCSEGLIIRFYGFCIANKVLFFFSRIHLFNKIRNLSLTDIDFCKPVVIHAFHWNFNLCLLIFLKEKKLVSNALILLSKDSVKYSTFCSSSFFCFILFCFVFFYLGLLSRTFMIHRTTGEEEVIYLSPVYHLHPLHRHLVHRHLDISQEITAESSPLLIASSRTRIGNSGTFGFRAQVAND